MSTNSLAVQPNGQMAQFNPTPDQIALIKRTICVDATDDELRLFLARCERTGLDPFLRQIYSIKRGGRHTIQVGIDGLRLVAQRTREVDGQDGPYWCGPDGVWKEVWLDKVPPAAAKVTVFRKGQSRGYVGIAHWSEYGSSENLWKKMPAGQLAKCAEALALRKACPQELSGLYADAEMDQADEPVRQEPRRPEPAPRPELSPAQIAELAEELAGLIQDIAELTNRSTQSVFAGLANLVKSPATCIEEFTVESLDEATRRARTRKKALVAEAQAAEQQRQKAEAEAIIVEAEVEAGS